MYKLIIALVLVVSACSKTPTESPSVQSITITKVTLTKSNACALQSYWFRLQGQTASVTTSAATGDFNYTIPSTDFNKTAAIGFSFVSRCGTGLNAVEAGAFNIPSLFLSEAVKNRSASLKISTNDLMARGAAAELEGEVFFTYK